MVVQNPIKITITNIQEGHEEILVIENNRGSSKAAERWFLTKQFLLREKTLATTHPRSFLGFRPEMKSGLKVLTSSRQTK